MDIKKKSVPLHQFFDNTDTGQSRARDDIIHILLILSLMTNKTQKAAAANVVENAAAAVNANDKGAKVTTFEELFAGHAMLPRTEHGAIILTDELFRNLAASHTYKYGEHVFKVLSKRSGTERGGKTLYNVKSGKDTFENVSIEELKEEFGCEYRREKASTKTALGKLEFEVSSKVANLVEECTSEVTESEYSELKNAYKQLRGLVGILRKAQQAAAEKAAAEKAAAEKAKKETEKADKSADKMSDAVLLAELKKRGLI